MDYRVRLVGDSDLPDGIDYTFARVADRTYLFMKQSACKGQLGDCDALTRSFNTWERAQSVPLKHLVAI